MQLSFGDSLDDKTQDKQEPKKESWYKGRTLSHSSVSTYQQCPQKWKFRYVDKIAQKPRSFFSFGKSVHSGLEFMFGKEDGTLPSVDEIIESFKKTWINEGYDTPSQERWFFQEGERILRGFYAKHKDDQTEVFKVELKFNFDVEGVPMTGFIDRLDLTPSGKLSILDYKTGKAFDKSRVKKDPQLTLYQMACREVLGKDVENLTLYHLNSLTPLTVPAHSPKLEEKVRESIVSSAKGINESAFEPVPDPHGHCRWCDYVQICPAFSGTKKLRTVRENQAAMLSEDVDRLGKLSERLEELAQEKEALEKNIAGQIKQSGQTDVKGEHFKASLDENSAPSLKISRLKNSGELQ